MVRYVLVIYDHDEEVYNIWHLMIDRDLQGNGYGKSALQAVLKYIASKPLGSSRTVLLTCDPQNKVAYRLYRQIGFTETGRSDDEELELGMTL